jgi:hypothetical protein
LPVATSHTPTRLANTTARAFPWRIKATERITCPGIRCSRLPLVASQRMTAWLRSSSLRWHSTAATVRPSGDGTAHTEAACPPRTRVTFAEATSHSRTVLSAPPATIVLPSEVKVRLHTRFSCPRSVCRTFHVVVSQNWTGPSSGRTTSVLPSGCRPPSPYEPRIPPVSRHGAAVFLWPRPAAEPYRRGCPRPASCRQALISPVLLALLARVSPWWECHSIDVVDMEMVKRCRATPRENATCIFLPDVPPNRIEQIRIITAQFLRGERFAGHLLLLSGSTRPGRTRGRSREATPLGFSPQAVIAAAGRRSPGPAAAA